MMNAWWMWIAFGVVLSAIELMTPGGFFIIFFGLAALVVGLLDLVGVIERPWAEWLLFSALAIVGLRIFRKPLLARLRANQVTGEVDSLVGEMAVAAAAMAPGEHGRVELRGTMWNGYNVGSSPIAAAQRCRVVAVAGLQLDVAAFTLIPDS